MHTYTRARTHAHSHTHIRAHAHARTRTFRTRTHAHTHTHSLSLSLSLTHSRTPRQHQLLAIKSKNKIELENKELPPSVCAAGGLVWPETEALTATTLANAGTPSPADYLFRLHLSSDSYTSLTRHEVPDTPSLFICQQTLAGRQCKHGA